VPAQLRLRLREDLESRLDPAQPIDVGEVLLVALEALLRGGPFDRIVACVLNADRSRLVPRSALGTSAEELMPRLDMEMSPRGGPVPAILQQRQVQYLPVDRAMTAADRAAARPWRVQTVPYPRGGFAELAKASPLPGPRAEAQLRLLNGVYGGGAEPKPGQTVKVVVAN
jgi:hypothetical protein